MAENEAKIEATEEIVAETPETTEVTEVVEATEEAKETFAKSGKK